MSVMSRPATTILTAMAFALPLATAAGDDAQRLAEEVIRAAKETDWPPGAQELRERVRQWQRSFETLRQPLAKRAGAKRVAAPGPGDKKAGGDRFDLPDGCYCFYAKSVAACQRMMPMIDGLRRQGFPIVKVDIEAKAELSKHYAIKAIPTILIKRGPQVVKLTGVQEERSLRSTLLQHHVKDEATHIAKGKDGDPLILLAYPVGDLLRESEPANGGTPAAEPDFDPLLHLIVSLIEPESWSEVGGPGQVRPVDITQSLIVRQTARVHAQIRIALDELRKLRIEAPDEKR